MVVQRLVQTSVGPVLVEADFDGVRARTFDEEGRLRKVVELEEPFDQAFQDVVGLEEPESRRLGAELDEEIRKNYGDEPGNGWDVLLVLLVFVGIWLFGVAALVYLLVEVL